MRRRLVWGGLAFALLLGLSQTAGFGARKTPASDAEQLYEVSELFADVLKIVQTDYVEEADPKDLIYGALRGMLSTLDPYSQFLDPESYNELKIETEGEFGGLGIEITIKDELLTVISPIDDTPAFRAGLRASDRIVKIDGALTRGITLLEAVKKLRGKPGTGVKLTILREGENEFKEVEVVRDIIKIKSVREAVLLDNQIGYLRLSDFQEQTTQEIEVNLERLKTEGMDSLILDLRNNPGGLLDVSVSVAQLFLEQRQLIVSTKGRLRNQNLEFRARRDGMLNGLPLVVLINEGSASASEIVAGAIQDHGRGVVLGIKSHGKASVQTIFPLRDGSALRLTTSKYFTPSGRSIHGEGIAPDVEVPFVKPPAPDASAKAAEQVFDQVESNGAEDGVEKPDLALDNQLARAVDLLKGIKVYQAKLHATP